MPVLSQVADEIITHQLDMLRIAAAERVEIFKKLKALEAELVDLLSDFNVTTDNKSRVERFVKQVNKTISEHFKEVKQQIDLAAIAEISAQLTAGLSVVLGLADELKMPTSNYMKSVASDVLIQGAPSADWWNGQELDLQRKFAAQLRLGMGAGETNQQIVSRIVGRNGVPGVMETARRNAAALVQTSVQTVANDARRQTFFENDDIIKGIRQISTLDGHTSLTCVAYSGAEWDLNLKPINGNKLAYNNGCPRHWNCRSVEVPITKTFREMGIDIDEAPESTRASVDGQIAAKTTFDDFLKRKGKEYQEEVLGPGRAELWREGKITLADLVNGSGNPLTLDQLKSKVSGVKPAKEPTLKELLSEANDKAKTNVLAKGRADNLEHMAAFDNKTGKAFDNVVKSNGKSHIEISDKFKADIKNPLNEIVAHHNHPINRPISLSPQDLLTVGENKGLKGLWAHSHEGSSFYAESSKLTAGAIKAIERKVDKFFKPIAKAGYLDVKAFNDHYAHVVNLALDKEGKINYSFDHSEDAAKSFAKNSFYINQFLELFGK